MGAIFTERERTELRAALADAVMVRDRLLLERESLLERCREADDSARDGAARDGAALIHAHLSTATIRLLLRAQDNGDAR
jgi:hypothetical protein